MDVGQREFGREKHLAEKNREELFISKTKKVSIRTHIAKAKNISAKQAAKNVMKGGGRKKSVSTPVTL